MTAAMFDPRYGQGEWRNPTNGVSEAAARIKEKAIEAIRSLTTNITSEDRDSALAESLLLIGEECSEEGWDGYRAAPIEPPVLNAALQYFKSLSEEIPLPEICGENDGEIALEWFGKNNATMSISVGKGPNVHYSAIFPDHHKAYGTESLHEKDKRVIEGFIKRVIA